ncbi:MULTISPECIES: hypothetical protein [unclassified Viridibacillus]|uniref:hypothetical protein n=1 Tax=unclassified Viridibacillus TaxID=2617942 RepID=UPI00096E35A2|nr:hypothetical protein [Viridibacillus sp. FSL H7-0596]OMC88722.1 hypothetical protein BK128_01935 [Viridibacillus sp. FSL H7-0596]
MKKIMYLLFMSVVFLIGSVGISGSASAASTSTSIKMNSEFPWGGTANITTSETHLNVNATFEAAYDSHVNVKLTLQRNNNGTWSDVATKSGLARNLFMDKSNLNVSFTNISNVLNKSHRIKVQIYNRTNGNHMQTAYSKTWVR